MAAASPIDLSDSTLSFSIKVNGSPIQSYYPVVSVSITHELNRLSFAEIVLIDGSVESGDFPISESADFVPDNPIEITAGYGDGAEQSIFKGVIVKQAIRINSGSPFNLVVSCKHKAVSMSFNRTEAQFSNKADSAIISSIVGNYGLSATVDATTPVGEIMVQKLATDWDFILSRADFYGYVLSCDGDDLVIGKPKVDSSAVLRIANGESIISFSAELNAERQPTALDVYGWDIKTLALVKSSAAEPGVNAQGNLTPKALSGKLSQKALTLTANTPMTKDDLQAWADGSLLRMRLASMKGQVSFMGSAAAKTNAIIELAGVGDRFNGDAYVSAVTHTIEDGTWVTLAKFGLDTKPVSQRTDFAYASALGHLPGIQGLQVGTVKKLFEDPDSQFRILVTLASNATSQDGIWARVANFYATAGAGSGFLPEVGDEVIVGFVENDPRYPVVLGSLYSSGKAAAATPGDNNNYIKTLITKSKLKISFDDEKKITTIVTPGGNSITLSDDAKSVEIVDQNGNSLKMTSDGINLESGKDITIKATGNINLSATGKVDVKATQDCTIAGMNVSQTAQVGFTAKGNATAEISASGQTTVKGGIVMIN